MVLSRLLLASGVQDREQHTPVRGQGLGTAGPAIGIRWLVTVAIDILPSKAACFATDRAQPAVHHVWTVVCAGRAATVGSWAAVR